MLNMNTLKLMAGFFLMFFFNPVHAFLERTNVQMIDPVGCAANLDGKVGPGIVMDTFSGLRDSCQNGGLPFEECASAQESCARIAFQQSFETGRVCSESFEVRFLWWNFSLVAPAADKVEEIHNQLVEMLKVCEGILAE